MTTKRKRRCGWLDLALLQYTSLVNGYTMLCLTKLDILDEFEEIKVGVSYKLDGKPIEYYPASIEDLYRVEVVYETLPGWSKNTQNIRDFNELPANAQKYIRFIEEHLECPIKWVGVGQGRESIIEVY